MRWFMRALIVGLCILLWVGLWFGTLAVTETAKMEKEKAPFLFPGFLSGSELYVWSLTTDDLFQTVLLVQNISQKTLVDVKIVFCADGEVLCFEAEYILPGNKAFLGEKQGAAFADWRKVVWVSYTALETENTSFSSDEDYGCK